MVTENTNQKEYKVSPLTARWLDCLVASQNLYTQIMDAAHEQYGAGADTDTIQKPLLEAYNALTDRITELMTYNISLNLGIIDNMKQPQPEI